MNKLSSSVLHLAAAAAIASSGDIMAKANDTTKPVDIQPSGSFGVTVETRDKIAKLQQDFPELKIKKSVQWCLSGTIIDESCESLVANELDILTKKIELRQKTKELELKKEELLKQDKALTEEKQALTEEKQALTEEKQALTEEKQALEKIKIIWDDITITTWLIQLGLYIDYNQVPSSEADAMSKVTGNKNTPEEVLMLFKEYLDHKKNGGTFTWKTHGERLISLANKYLTKAMEIESSIQNPDIKKDATDLIKLTVKFYDTNVKMLNKNDNPIVAIK